MSLTTLHYQYNRLKTLLKINSKLLQLCSIRGRHNAYPVREVGQVSACTVRDVGQRSACTAREVGQVSACTVREVGQVSACVL